MRVIRKNLFETNSSSVHCLAISKESINLNELPKSISTSKRTYFSWNNNKYNMTKDKLLYILIALINTIGYNDNEDKKNQAREYYNQLIKILEDHGIKIKIDYDQEKCYIDHEETVMEDVIPELFKSEDKILRFLFNKKSYIETGNDNDEYGQPSIPSEEDYEVIIKYN